MLYVIYISTVMIHYCFVLKGKEIKDTTTIAPSQVVEKNIELGQESTKENSQRNINDLLKKYYLKDPIMEDANEYEDQKRKSLETRSVVPARNHKTFDRQDAMTELTTTDITRNNDTKSTCDEVKNEFKAYRSKFKKKLSINLDQGAQFKSNALSDMKNPFAGDLSPDNKSVVTMAEMKTLYNMAKEEVEKESKNIWTIAYQCYEAPLNALRKYSIFPNMEEQLNTKFLPFYPLTGTIAFYVLTGQYMDFFYFSDNTIKIPKVIVASLCSMPVCFIILYLQIKKVKQILYVFIPLSLVMCVLW